MAFKEMAVDELTAADRGATDGIAALNAIDARMRSEGGPEVAPDFGPLLTHLAKLVKIYRDELSSRGETAGGVAGADGQPAAAAGFAGGVINSRQDAIRALDAVADYFRRNEPSSPIPLFVERAKRLVAKDFLEVLADIAPDALAVARSAGGLKEP
jgi:type VI secretion system protein ImpA